MLFWSQPPDPPFKSPWITLHSETHPNIMFSSFFLKAIHWIYLVPPICSWFWGHLLEPVLPSAKSVEGLGQVLHLLHVWRGKGSRAFFPNPHYHMADERGMTSSPILNLQSQLSHAPVNRVSSLELHRWGVGPFPQSASAGEGLDQFPLKLQPMRLEASPVPPYPLGLQWYQGYIHEHRPCLHKVHELRHGP